MQLTAVCICSAEFPTVQCKNESRDVQSIQIDAWHDRTDLSSWVDNSQCLARSGMMFPSLKSFTKECPDQQTTNMFCAQLDSCEGTAPLTRAAAGRPESLSV